MSKKRNFEFNNCIYDNSIIAANPRKAGMNATNSYGDKNYETTNGSKNYEINDIKIYQLLF